MKNIVIAFYALILCVSTVFAQEKPVELLDANLPPELEEVITKAVLLHREGVKGNKDAVEEAVELLEGIDGDMPPISIGFLGSLYTLKGRDAKNVVNAMRFTNRGIGLIDEAVDLQPDGYSLRMLRAINNIEIPAMFGRKDIAIADMKFIAEKYKDEDHSRSLDTFKDVLGHLIKHAKDTEAADDQKRWEDMLASLN